MHAISAFPFLTKYLCVYWENSVEKVRKEASLEVSQVWL